MQMQWWRDCKMKESQILIYKDLDMIKVEGGKYRKVTLFD